MKKLAHNISLTLLLIVAAMSTWRWIFPSPVAPLDPDEVVWVLDAEASSWYGAGEWSHFKLSKPFEQLIWFEPEYRLIDQPQLGKYLIGFYLSALDLEPWQSEQKNRYYVSFMKAELPTGQLDQLAEHYEPELLEAVVRVRQLNMVVGLVAVALAAYFISLLLKSKQYGLLFFILVVNHLLVTQYYQLAIVNSFSFLFQVLAVAALYRGWKKATAFKGLPTSDSIYWQVAGWGAVAGGLVAAAASTKLDGLFLVAPPVLGGVWLLLLIWWAHWNNSKQAVARYTTFLAWFLVWVAGFLLAGVGIFLVLEPEILVNGFEGLVALLGSRLAQQARFAEYGESLSWSERVAFFIKASWLQPWPVKALLGGVVLLSLKAGLLAYLSWRSSSAKKIQKFQQGWFEPTTHGFLIIILASIMVGSLYASRVGFDRYIISAVIAGYVVWLKVLVLASKNYET